MAIDMEQFFEAFFDETEELLAEMEKLLLALDVAAPDAEDLNAIFRAAHSIKGGAATFGIADLTEVTHVLETLLDRIRKGEMALTADHVDAFLAAKDVLTMQLAGHRHHAPVDQAEVDQVSARLAALSEDVSEVDSVFPTKGGFSPTPSQPLTIKTNNPSADTQHAGKPLRRFRVLLPEAPIRDVDALAAELGLLGEVQKHAFDDRRFQFELTTPEDQYDILAICSFVLEPEDLVITEIGNFPEEVSASPLSEDPGYGFFEPMLSRIGSQESEHTEQQSSAPSDAVTNEAAGKFLVDSRPAASSRQDSDKTATHIESTSIRVSVEKVDQLINLVGELVITQAMIEQRSETLDPTLHERLLNSVSQLTRNTRDLQEAVMSIRMMPMDYVFSRFPRMVRDLAGKMEKKIELVTQGAATELDKGLIEKIIDPLTHLVRNSIDHGIETPAERLAAGKNEAGRLSLSATHQGGHIVIEVSDDGSGLNRPRILAKARQSGLPVSDAMPDEEVWQLIFAPGFSTAAVVTSVSGRGVGMDVVKRNITALGGTVDIRSSPGFGTTILVSLPLTLAILDGMSVRVADEIYILPLGYVIESMRPEPGQIKEVSGQGSLIRVRNDYLPLLPLYQIFGIVPRHTDPANGILVIVESEGKKAALFVDDLVGQQQVVVKNLEANYRRVAGVSGATILGDGGVALILDIAALLRSGQQLAHDPVYQ